MAHVSLTGLSKEMGGMQRWTRAHHNLLPYFLYLQKTAENLLDGFSNGPRLIGYFFKHGLATSEMLMGLGACFEILFRGQTIK